MSNIWLRANQRKTRTQNHQNLTTVLLRLSKYWHILHRSATTRLQNAARNVKAENRRVTAQSSWVCQVYRREILRKHESISPVNTTFSSASLSGTDIALPNRKKGVN